MKIVELKPRARDLTAALETIDSLRADVASGCIVAFIAVGIEVGDETRGWCSSTANVTRLRLMGAVASLQASLHAGDIG